MYARGMTIREIRSYLAEMYGTDVSPELDRVFVTRLDVQDLASIQAAVEAGISKYGRIARS